MESLTRLPVGKCATGGVVAYVVEHRPELVQQLPPRPFFSHRLNFPGQVICGPIEAQLSLVLGHMQIDILNDGGCKFLAFLQPLL